MRTTFKEIRLAVSRSSKQIQRMRSYLLCVRQPLLDRQIPTSDDKSSVVLGQSHIYMSERSFLEHRARPAILPRSLSALSIVGYIKTRNTDWLPNDGRNFPFCPCWPLALRT